MALTFSALGTVFSIAVMIGVGYLLAHLGLITESVNKFIAKVVVNVALPASMIYKFTTSFSREMLLEYRFVIMIPFAAIFLNYMAGRLLSRVAKISQNQRGVFCAMFAMSNVAFMGIPVNLVLFGPDSAPIIYLYFIANAVMFWTFGARGIARDLKPADDRKFDPKSLKVLLNGGFLGVISGVTLVFLGITFPPIVNNTLNHLGSLVTPLPMLFIGGIIYRTDWQKFKVSKEMLLISMGRFAVSPLIVVAMFMFARNFISFDPLVRNVFVMQASMPIMSQIPLITKEFNADTEFATVMATATTLLSLLAIPIIRVLLG